MLGRTQWHADMPCSVRAALLGSPCAPSAAGEQKHSRSLANPGIRQPGAVERAPASRARLGWGVVETAAGTRRTAFRRTKHQFDTHIYQEFLCARQVPRCSRRAPLPPVQAAHWPDAPRDQPPGPRPELNVLSAWAAAMARGGPACGVGTPLQNHALWCPGCSAESGCTHDPCSCQPAHLCTVKSQLAARPVPRLAWSAAHLNLIRDTPQSARCGGTYLRAPSGGSTAVFETRSQVPGPPRGRLAVVSPRSL